MMLFAAVHESPIGTTRTCRNVRLSSAIERKADVPQTCQGASIEMVRSTDVYRFTKTTSLSTA
jgi:hypothetical protein